MAESLVPHLADVIRHSNKLPYGSGDPRHKGMVILQKGNKRTTPKTWEEGSTVPEDVADILLSIQFHQRKVIESLFDAAEEIARCLKLNLSWDEDYALGAFLISCLVKAKYYSLYNLFWTGDRWETGLSARKKEVLEEAPEDWNTGFMPFPEWTGPIDEEGRWLVKPSYPQQKKTFWKPGPEYFQGQNKRGSSDYTIKWGAMGMEIDPSLIMDTSEVMGLNPAWIKAVHKLESNAYRINQELLQVVNAIAEDENSAPPKTNPVLDAEKNKLDREFRRKRKGSAVVDSKELFKWSDFVDKRYEVQLPKKKSKAVETRSLEHLSRLQAAQKKQDKERRKKKLKAYPKDSPERKITENQAKVLNEFWDRWYTNKTAMDALRTKHNDFQRTLKHCNQYLQDN